MERFDDICPENEFEDKNYNEEYDREYSFGSNNIVVFLTIQYYCLPLRHE